MLLYVPLCFISDVQVLEVFLWVSIRMGCDPLVEIFLLLLCDARGELFVNW